MLSGKATKIVTKKSIHVRSTQHLVGIKRVDNDVHQPTDFCLEFEFLCTLLGFEHLGSLLPAHGEVRSAENKLLSPAGDSWRANLWGESAILSRDKTSA